MEKKDAKESARKSFNLFKKKPSVSDVADTNGKDPLSPRSKKSAEVLESPRSRKGIFRRLASHDTVSRKEKKEAEKDLKRSCSSTSASEELSSSAEAESVEAVEEVEPVVLEPVEECDNIWGESDKAQNIRLISPTSHMHDVRCATLNKLVERLTTFSVVGDGFDQLQRIFFMTFRSFASPTDILERMIARYEGPPPDSGIELSEDELRDIRKAVCLHFKFWFTNHFRDFSSDDQFKRRFQEWLQGIEEAEKEAPSKESLVPYLAGIVNKKLSKGSYTSLFDSSVMVHDPPPPIVPRSWRGVQFTDLDELEIARQLTIAEYHIYAEVQPVELQDLAWSKAKLKHRAGNVLGLINRFNWISGLISTLIVSTPLLKDRKRVVEMIVKICMHLYDMHNYNSVMAILSGISASAVYRLKHTFAALSKEAAKFLEKMNEVMSANQSYKELRASLAEAQPPCIPFLGVYLTDLTFVEDGNPDKVDGMINFKKRALEYDIIVQVLKYQDLSYPFKLVPQFESILKRLPSLGEQDLYQLSLGCEPRKAKKKDLK